jgi:integrase
MSVGAITKRAVDALPPGAFLWDTRLKGFGCKVTRTGTVYILQYRSGRRLRRYTIGRHGALTPDLARTEAIRLLGLVAGGTDPATVKQAGRVAVTVAEVAARMSREFLVKKRARTRTEYERLLRVCILPTLGSLAVASVTREDVARLHHRMRATPTQGNRSVAVLSKLLTLAEVWGLRALGSNPCRLLERNREVARERYLSAEELGRLGHVLGLAARGPLPGMTATISPFALAAIGLLVFTGARRGEILGLRWSEVDLVRGLLRLPESKTGAKTIYLNEPAKAIIEKIPRVDGNAFVIVGARAGQHLVNVGSIWLALRAAAKLPDVRLHDLRHSFASVGADGGLSIPVLGKLLGHSRPATTARYSHVSVDPAQAAAALIGARLAAAMTQGQAPHRKH